MQLEPKSIPQNQSSKNNQNHKNNKKQREHVVNRMSSSLPKGGQTPKYHLDTQLKTVQKQTPET